MTRPAIDFDPSLEESVQRATGAASRYAEARDFAGYDPYDALNSPVLRALTLGLSQGRIFWTQVMRRLPVNVRPLLGTPRGRNPKALGLFLMSGARQYYLDPSEHNRHLVETLIQGLVESRSPGVTGHAWGYNFDWQSRAAFVPRGTPTIVNTAFIGHALLDASVLAGSREALDLARPAAEFILHDLNRRETAGDLCFSYTPLDHNYVHNANLLGASLLIRLHALGGPELYRETALRSLAYTLKHQHQDGSWAYAETPFQQWCDSFHTGFNLQAIRMFLRLGEARQATAAYQAGVDYYARHFFLADGAPKYYNTALYPIDIHAPAQALAFFSAEPGCEDLAHRIAGWMLKNLFDPRDGHFYFRRGRLWVNRIPYMRWSQAWGLHGLTSFRLARMRAPAGVIW